MRLLRRARRVASEQRRWSDGESRGHGRSDIPGAVAACARVVEPGVIGEGCLVFNQVVIYEGSRLGDRCVVEDRVRIGYGTRVAGFVCDGAVIGARSTMMGRLAHEYCRPHRGWWEVDEPAPLIHEDTVVGFDALVVGGVSIGPRSYVAAVAGVTRDVPPGHVVTGTNGLTPAADWPGARLKELLAHGRRDASG